VLLSDGGSSHRPVRDLLGHESDLAPTVRSVLRVNKQVVTAVLGLLLLVMATSTTGSQGLCGVHIRGDILGLLLLRIPGLAASETGTSNFINIPGVSLLQISPSEFAKIGLIVILAAMLSELRSPVPTVPDLVRVIGVAGVTMLLVFVNVEIGTTIVLRRSRSACWSSPAQAKHLIALAAPRSW
jgi:cell division protein FtsW (lipid II flippase)